MIAAQISGTRRMLSRLKDRVTACRKTMLAYSYDKKHEFSPEEMVPTKAEVETLENSILNLSRTLLGGNPPENLWIPLDQYARQNYERKKDYWENEAEYFRWYLMAIEKTQMFLDYLEGFQDTGKPEPGAVPVESLRPSTTRPVQEILGNLQSVFVSYGGPDERLATKINDALKRVGVRTFFFPDDAEAGAKLHRVMSDGVNEFDRILLICSRDSLNRSGVLNEIERTLQREAREGGKTIIIPITIDDYVFSEWSPENPDLARELRDRVIADFRDTQNDVSAFEKAVGRVVAALIRDR